MRSPLNLFSNRSRSTSAVATPTTATSHHPSQSDPLTKRTGRSIYRHGGGTGHEGDQRDFSDSDSDSHGEESSMMAGDTDTATGTDRYQSPANRGLERSETFFDMQSALDETDRKTMSDTHLPSSIITNQPEQTRDSTSQSQTWPKNLKEQEAFARPWDFKIEAGSQHPSTANAAYSDDVDEEGEDDSSGSARYSRRRRDLPKLLIHPTTSGSSNSLFNQDPLAERPYGLQTKEVVSRRPSLTDGWRPFGFRKRSQSNASAGSATSGGPGGGASREKAWNEY